MPPNAADPPRPAPAESASVSLAHGGRLVALDVFRGLTIAAMILVNSPGATRHAYPLLRHAKWNGWRPADLVFPAFLFIAGVAIPLSLQRQIDIGTARRRITQTILARTRIIFGLGLLLNALPYFDWDVLRIPGVLQRIALCYGAAALIALYTDIRTEAVIALALLLAYWALLTLVPVPGIGAGVLEPGMDLGAYVDRTLMGHHLGNVDWDAEGLLGTIPAIATTLAGVLAGHWMRRAVDAQRRLIGLVLAGIVLVVAGEIWGRWLPINKSLWTSSYAVFTAGTSLLGFALCFWLIDVLGYRRWTLPFIIYGTNPILAYGLSSLVTKFLALVHVTGANGLPVSLQLYIYDRVFAPLGGVSGGPLLYAVTYTLLWLGIMALLYRRGVFVKI